MGQEAKLRILCRYFHNERKKSFNNIFTDEIKNIIIESNFFCSADLLVRMEFFGGWGEVRFTWGSRSVFPIIKLIANVPLKNRSEPGGCTKSVSGLDFVCKP